MKKSESSARSGQIGKGMPSQTEARDQLRRMNIRAAKGLGQNFLVDPGVLDRIIAAAELNESDLVVEVGPGLGILTRELVRRAGKVIAVEIDTKLASSLSRTFKDVPSLTVINADILDVDPNALVGGNGPGIRQGYKVVANLPYYIATTVLRRFLEATVKPKLMVVMVQREVGESMVAGPGSMSLLSVSVQLYGRPSIVDFVPAKSFYPEPNVDSAIVRIDVYPQPALDIDDIPAFFETVKAGFSAPRKQMRNALAIGLGLPTSDIVDLLREAGIASQRRPETLTIEEWASLYRAFSKSQQE